MPTEDKSLDQIIDQSEKLGVIGSPSSTAELAIDVRGHAVNRKLVGELALFRYLQDNSPHYALGQITEIQLRNIWHEDPTMRSLIRQRGRVDAVSERQDTHLGKMAISAVFSEKRSDQYEPSILGTVPSTGTDINLVTDPMLDKLLEPYREQIFYLGHVYGSEPKLPLWFKHFDKGPDGAGEAYHLGVFGKTGSGKSELSRMIMLAYSRYPDMGLLVIDPQGEFSKGMDSEGTGEFQLPIGKITSSLGKDSFVLTVRNLVLDRWNLFEQILYESNFFDRLTIRYATNKEPACSVLCEELVKKKIKLKDLYLKSSFEEAWKILSNENIQKKFAASAPLRDRFTEALNDADQDDYYNTYWKPITQLFRTDRNGARTVEKALNWLLAGNDGKRPILVIDLSKEQAGDLFWNDKIQALVIKRLLDGLMQVAESFYNDDESLNTLVMIDEAHRLAPRDLPREEEIPRQVRATLIDAARTTRKYGLGWLFISQTLSSIHPEIIQQLRIFFFGFGLSLGLEYQSLRQMVGSSEAALELYRSFRDPHSAMDINNKQYPFMTIGPVSPLSFSGSPLFLNVYNKKEKFLEVNGLSAK